MKRIVWLLLIFVLIVIAAYLFFKKNDRGEEYYVVTGSDAAFSLGDPVYVDGTIAGFINDIHHLTDSTSHTVLAFDLSKGVNIPAGSELGVIMIDTGNLDIALNFQLVPSEGYIKPGDTLYLVLDKIARVVKKVTEPKKESKPPAVDAGAIQSASTQPLSGISYKVQLLSSDKSLPADSKEFKGIKNVKEYKYEGFYKYYVGEAVSLSEAKALQKEVVKAGITDAFIVPFYNGNRISWKESRALQK